MADYFEDDLENSVYAPDDDSDEDFYEPSKAKAKKAAAPKAKAPAAPKAPKAPAAPKIAKPKATKARADEGENGDGPAKAAPKPKKATPVLAEVTNLQPTAAAAAPATSSATIDGRPIEEVYQKKSQLEHILLRPDTYIGSVEEIAQPLWVFENDKMVYRMVKFVPGLYKIFDEILVNAADNKVRDPSMNLLKVTVDRATNTISVYNNGRGIPVEIHAQEQVYVPELIFGHLLTSSNYNDNEKKVTGGRNGYGAKLCNIFSTEFIVETADSRSGRKFRQVFSKNMTERSEPRITASKDDYTQITFKPDLAKFGLAAIDDDFEALVRKRVYDMAGCCSGVKVFYNDERIKIKNFKEYVELYMSARSTPSPIVHEVVNGRWEVAATLSDGQFTQVSFVNSICTYKGGTHVTYIADQLGEKVVEAVNKKNKAAPVKLHQAKNHIWVFINCLIENPTFDSQTKENMTLRASAFGSKCELSDDFHKKFLKSGIIDNILDFAKFKQNQLLKKTDGAKSARVSGIPKLDDANMAGTREAEKCTLILTEGDSAKALAVSGLSVVGRDYFGVFPLRGKLLNVREASHSQIMDNQEITHIKKILGLQHGKEYESAKGLRYGHLMIMADQDHDGSHIKGLIINFLDHFFPSLLRVPGFLLEFITPIVKATKNKQELSFFTIPEYEQWRESTNNGQGWTIKYYKGLGTSTSAEAKEYFSKLAKHRKPFAPCTAPERELIDMAFNKKKADERKEWLRNFKAGTYMDHSVGEIKVEDFINRELILFSMADNVRSIPSVIDGWKPGQRKILYSCFKRNLKAQIKVAQLAGYVAEHSAYHHGEQSLSQTIIGMAQNFPGANNVNVLAPIGQFGTRLQGGKDAASPRYIFTTLCPITRTIFHEQDDALLTYLDDDGQRIEPEWYVPILPMVLVNGSDGIGTGWSSYIPNYNPADIVANIRALLRGDEITPMQPWFRGFKGLIEPVGADKYRVSGIINKLDDTTLEVVELPIRTWTQSYKEFLEGLMEGSEKAPAFIKGFKEYHTDTTVHFVITLSPENMAIAEKEGFDKRFKMSTTIATSNMVCFDKEGRIKRYATPEEILQDFFATRLEFYQKRKNALLDKYTNDFTRIDNKVRFVTEFIEGKLVVAGRKKQELVADLIKRKYTPMPRATNKAAPKVAGNIDDEVEAGESAEEATSVAADFHYLLSMPIDNLTMEKVEELKAERAKKEAELNELLSKSTRDLWEADLDAFMATWEAELATDETAVTRPAGAPKWSATARTVMAPRAPAAAPKPKAAPKATPTAPVDLAAAEPIVTKPAAAPAPAPAPAPKAAAMPKRIAADAGDMSSPTRPPPATKKARPAARKKKVILSDSEDDDYFVDEDEDAEDDDEDFGKGAAAAKPPPLVAERPSRRAAAAKKVTYIYKDSSEDEDEDDEYDEDDE